LKLANDETHHSVLYKAGIKTQQKFVKI